MIPGPGQCRDGSPWLPMAHPATGAMVAVCQAAVSEALAAGYRPLNWAAAELVRYGVTAGAPVVGAWLPWFSTRTQWRAVRVSDPLTKRVRWLGPRNLSADAAQVWVSQIVEQNWDSSADLYTFSPSGWKMGV